MSHQITWPVPHRVVMTSQFGLITAEEAGIIAQDICNAIEADSSSVVHVFINTGEATMGDKLWNYAKVEYKSHPRTGFTIVIGDSQMTGLLIALLSKLLNPQLRYIASIEGALKFLQERDEGVAEYLAAIVSPTS